MVTLFILVGNKESMNLVFSGNIWRIKKTKFADEFDIEWGEKEEMKMTLRFGA